MHYIVVTARKNGQPVMVSGFGIHEDINSFIQDLLAMKFAVEIEVLEWQLL